MAQELKCPYCEIRLKSVAGTTDLKCGICGSTFNPKDLGAGMAATESETVDFAKEFLRAQKELEVEKKGDLVFVHSDQLMHVPRWKMWLSYFGLPVEEESDGVGFPIVLGLYSLLCVAIFALGPGAAKLLQLDPKHLFRLAGLPFVTYSLVHDGLFHLVMNMFFLLPFIDKVEENLGAAKTLLLVLCAALGSSLLHLTFDSSGLPLVGASGVCFAVIVYYAIKFPRNSLLIAPPIIGIFTAKYRLRVRARTFAIFYVAQEIIGALLQSGGDDHVSHLGHLGGAAVALLFCYFAGDEA